MTLEKVRRVSEAHGAICEDCGVVFEAATCPYWHFSKSKWMHEQGSKHRVSLYRIVR